MSASTRFEHFVGDWGIANNMAYTSTAAETGKKVAIIGAGPAGLAAAYQLRLRGHGVTISTSTKSSAACMRYGIPGSARRVKCSTPKSSASSISAWKPV